MIKRILFAITLVILVTTVAWGAEDLVKMPVSTTLNTSTYVAVATGTDVAYGFSVFISNGTAWYIASDTSGTGETLIEDHVPNINWGHYVNANTTVFYAKAFVGTPDIVIFPGKHK